MTAPEIVTFGCRLNTYESEIIRERAAATGETDIVVFNTCAVTSEAVRQARQAIRKARRANPRSRIIVTGCAAQIEPTDFAAMPEVDLVLGNEEKLHTHSYRPRDFGVEEAEKIRVNDIMSVRETAGHMLDGLKDRARAFVQIQNGCDHRCTFCIIPFGRGNSRSVPMGAVVDQVRHLVGNGYREIVLTGVDITSYGADLPGRPSFSKLVKTVLDQVPDLERLRISSIDCIEVDDALMDVIANEQRLMPHLHLSLQSGDDMILKRMKRRHSRDESIAFCREARKVRPDMVFGADIIAGFPTETDDMFSHSKEMVAECGLTYLHVFPYSARPGTPAARMPQVNGEIVKARAKALRHLGKKAQTSFYQSLVGQQYDVLVENDRIARTPHFAPVRIDRDMPAGEIVQAKIESYVDGELKGSLGLMAEEKSEGFFKRVFGRFGGKKDAPEQVEQETVAPEAVPQAPKSAPDPALAEARVETPSAKAKPAPKKKKVEAKAPTTRKTPAKKPVEKKAPAKKTRPEKLAEKPAAKKTPAAKETKPVAAPKAVESEGMPVAKVPAKKATPRPKPKPKPKSKPKPASEPELKPVIEPKPEPAPEPVPAPAPVPEKPSPPPEPVPPPQPAPIQAPEPEPVSEPVATPEPAPPAEEPAKKKGWFSRLKEGLARSSNQLTENITAVFTKRKLDDDTLQELEDVLIQADLGVETAMKITEEVARGRFNKEISDQEIREILGAEVAKVLGHVAKPLAINSANRPHIILVVGVNGTGKTTTIGKLAAKFRGEGKSVMLAAGDTFRAAAIDQLKIWGERVGASVIARDVGADSSGLAFDAIRDARAQGIDVLLIDTAGRLQNQDNLMAELEKLRRVISKQDESAPHDVLLVLDATTGQNALQQVEIFGKVAGVSGLVMTKLDGTARGGILVAIAAKYGLPVHAIGVGETVDDLQPFEASQFANAIAGLDEDAA